MFLVIDIEELWKEFEFGTPMISLASDSFSEAVTYAEMRNRSRVEGHKTFGVFELTELVPAPENPEPSKI